MWKKYLEGEPEARIFLSLLSPERSEKEDVKLFLKIRKSIVRTVGPKLMQDTQLTHCNLYITIEDLLTLSHTIFTSEMKSYTCKKIHELFLALSKKSIHANKYLHPLSKNQWSSCMLVSFELCLKISTPRLRKHQSETIRVIVFGRGKLSCYTPTFSQTNFK